ncbi:hypothetical protein E2C01_062333 [Portunus trituberculatus]|uniref:Uncharacterized protein n=1 Tax=Portunus trituberculatus TaxID=210409 RepID=A0A5B7HFS6_PORTR|nr:hypothetical protein [Portunus trituberculatus]
MSIGEVHKYCQVCVLGRPSEVIRLVAAGYGGRAASFVTSSAGPSMHLPSHFQYNFFIFSQFAYFASQRAAKF